MSNTVAARAKDRQAVQPITFPDQKLSLYAGDGSRKYLNRDERQRVLVALDFLEPDQALFVLTLAWTGGRVSEVLALTPTLFQIELAIVTLRTLKRRKPATREVPIPPELMHTLDRHFRVLASQRDPQLADRRLWPWHRVTAWRIIKRVMVLAEVVGRQACPRGLRHGFGVGTLQSGVPLNLLQRWLGHARLSTTSIYAAVCGPEEREFAARFWELDGRSDLCNLP